MTGVKITALKVIDMIMMWWWWSPQQRSPCPWWWPWWWRWYWWCRIWWWWWKSLPNAAEMRWGGRSLVSAAKIKFKTWNQTQSTQLIIWDFLKDVLIVNLFCNHHCSMITVSRKESLRLFQIISDLKHWQWVMVIITTTDHQGWSLFCRSGLGGMEKGTSRLCRDHFWISKSTGWFCVVRKITIIMSLEW